MSDGSRPGGQGGALFESVDPRLNVFALANGMDLAKGPGFRRLEWFKEGFERGILIEPGTDGAFRLDVLTWPYGSQEIRERTTLAEGLTDKRLIEMLPGAIDSANDL